MRGPHLQSHMTFWLGGHVTDLKNLYLLFRNTYGHQNWQNNNLGWGNPTFKVMWPFDYVVTWQTQKTYLHLHNTKATKLGRVLTYIGGIPSTTSSNLLISWKTKNLITVFPQYLEPPNLASINLRLEHSTKSCDNLITWSREKLKNIYLHFNNICGSQTWQSGGLWWGTPFPKPCERVAKWLRGHCMLNVFKAFVPIILKILSLLSLMLCFLDDEINLMLSYLTLRRSPP